MYNVKGSSIEYTVDGKVLAVIEFPMRSDGAAEINRTFVDDSLRGQGIAGALMEKAVEELRRRSVFIVPSCSYAEKWFEKHPEHTDLLAR